MIFFILALATSCASSQSNLKKEAAPVNPEDQLLPFCEGSAKEEVESIVKEQLAEEMDMGLVRTEVEIIYCTTQIHEKAGYFIYSVKVYEIDSEKDYIRVDKLLSFVKKDDKWFLVQEIPIFMDLNEAALSQETKYFLKKKDEVHEL